MERESEEKKEKGGDTRHFSIFSVQPFRGFTFQVWSRHRRFGGRSCVPSVAGYAPGSVSQTWTLDL